MMPLEVFFILAIEMSQLLMEYGERKLIDIPSLLVYSNEKIGIIGENGTGKTTLLDLIAGRISPAKGSITVNGRLSYITQSFDSVSIADPSNEKYQWLVPDTPFSGGEVMRAKISKALAEQSEILLCDEPTSNLDEEGIVQLEQALSIYKGTVLLVSHDRVLMEHVCTKIWAIKDGHLKAFPGNYTSFKEQQERERQNQQKEYDTYIRTKKSLERALLDRSSKAKSMTNTPSRMGNSEARLHRMDVRQRAGKVSGSANIIKSRLEMLEVKEKVRTETNYQVSTTPDIHKAGKTAVRVNNLSFAYGPQPILREITFRVKRGERICISGLNGSGKTTLLNCIAEEVDGVTIGPKDEIGYFEQNGAGLDKNDSILGFVMRTSRMPEHMSRTVLAELGIKRADVYKKIRMLSGGERSKTALAALICRQPSILILDEPTNYLDVYMLEALERMLAGYEGTLMFVSHDRLFRQNIATRELRLEGGQLIEEGLKPPKADSDYKAKIMLLELKAEGLIQRQKTCREDEVEKTAKEYQAITAEINRLKAQINHD